MKNQQECPERPDTAASAPKAPVTRGARPADPKRAAKTKRSAKAEPVIDLSAFSAAERDRLARLRRRVRSGERGESYPVDRRQEFVRWLVERGKLSDK